MFFCRAPQAGRDKQSKWQRKLATKNMLSATYQWHARTLACAGALQQRHQSTHTRCCSAHVLIRLPSLSVSLSQPASGKLSCKKAMFEVSRPGHRSDMKEQYDTLVLGPGMVTALCIYERQSGSSAFPLAAWPRGFSELFVLVMCYRNVRMRLGGLEAWRFSRDRGRRGHGPWTVR